MIINKYPLNFPFRSLSIGFLFLTLIIGIVSGKFWTFFLIPIFLLPFIRMFGLKISHDKKEIHYLEYNWFKRSVSSRIKLQDKIEKIHIKTYSHITRTNPYGDVGVYSPEYIKQEKYAVLCLVIQSGNLCEKEIYKSYNINEVRSITNYISRELNIPILHTEEIIGDMEQYDMNEFNDVEKKFPWIGFKMLKIKRKKKQQPTQK